MPLVLELIGLIFYIVIIIIVLIIVFYRCDAEQRKVLVSFVFLLSLIVLNTFIDIPIIQFLLFFLMILDLLYIIYVQILPYFYTQRDRLLFVEVANELWEELKVNETIVQEEDKK